MPELLLELFSEEIPARMQGQAAEELARNVLERLKAVGLNWAPDSAQTSYTPQRLVLSVDGLPLETPEVTEEKRGPRVGAPDQAIQGFLRSAGLTSLGQCEKRDTGKGEFWFAIVRRHGQKTADLLPHIVTESVFALVWPKSMRWSRFAMTWVRPLKSILAVFDGEPLGGWLSFGNNSAPTKMRGWSKAPWSEIEPQTLEFGYLPYSNITRGHRFLDPREIKVAGFADYKAMLKEAFVIIDKTERRAMIERDARGVGANERLVVKHDADLLDEVTGLVEWPVALMGRIDGRFMDLPPEVLTSSMRVNQKYFSLLDKAGKLAPRFIVIANMQTKDGGKAIVAGNERVLRARLSDAKFFWDQDRKVKLKDRVPGLKEIVFHAKLGTVSDKVSRMDALVVDLHSYLPDLEIDQARSAALLAKADLTSGMVGEFPELQGTIGRYYALADGEKPAVADAIAEHYAPRGFNDRCPTAPVSVAVALADKIDSLVGFFAIDETPTGSKDPFALRRAALGVIRLIVENSLRLPLRQIFARHYHQGIEPTLWRQHTQNTRTQHAKASRPQPTFDVAPSPEEHEARKRAVASELISFIADRLKVALREKGVRHDLIAAVLALGGEDDLVRLLARVEALKSFLDGEDGGNLLVAYRRASNIVRIEEKKDGKTYNSGVDGELLRQDEEKALHRALAASGEAGGRALQAEDFAGAMGALAQLRRPVDDFFDKVTVNCDDADLRANRLRLLSDIRTTLNRVADFSQIEG